MIRNKTVLFIFRLLVGGLFIYAGVLKVAEPVDFARNISNYRLVPHVIAFFTALVLPWIEILAGALLVLGVFRRTNALLIAAMLVFFIVLVAVTMIRGIDVDCGCFGTFSRKADWSLILEDAVMLFMVLQVALAAESGKPAPAGPPREPLS
ncbi:MAG: MauE/DoxX family redox-associated membrane protein [Candidatus Aminicenantales bacterium]